MTEDIILNETNPLTHFDEQVRAIEALLFASSDPLDEKVLMEILPASANITIILEKIVKSYEGISVA